jgi:hypothetical protein
MNTHRVLPKMECLPQQAFHFSVSSVRSSPIALEKSAQVFLFSSCFMMGKARYSLLKTWRNYAYLQV